MRLSLGKELGVCALVAALVAGCGEGDGADGINGVDGPAGEDGATSVLSVSDVPEGDEDCPAGGKRIDIGLDNGDGGGTAGDGRLQTGEIDQSQFACNGPTVTRVGDLTAPTGANGTYSINVKGGNATGAGGNGGDGGYTYFYHDYGTNGGHIKLFKGGQVDASFTLPTLPANPNYGASPLVVLTGTKPVKVVNNLTDATTTDAVALVAGDIVRANNSGCGTAYNLYRWNSVSSTTQVTGIRVAAGATLQFEHVAACTQHRVTIPFTVRNEGTIIMSRDAAGNSDDLYMEVGAYIGATGSALSSKGADATSANGGNGGDIEVNVDSLNDDVGSFWSFGTADSSGGDGNNGGNAGFIHLHAGNQFINTGGVTGRGGDALLAAGTAGDGGDIELYGEYGQTNNSGAIDSSGGGGGTIAGDAGDVGLWANSNTELRSTGNITANGGVPTTGCLLACRGGDGGYIELYAYGDLYNSANIVTGGGDGLTGDGGDGGDVDIYSYYDPYSLVSGNSYNPPRGNVWVSGNLDLHGANGNANGGDGGELDVYTYLDYQPFGQEIVLFGYGGGVNGSAGTGVATGGDANGHYIYHNNYGETYEGDYTAAGSIFNQLDFTANGGEATGGTGGHGGYLEFYTDQQRESTSVGFEKLINFGNIVMNGGNGTTGGGYADYVFMDSLDGTENHGNITANGGRATAAAGTAGYCSDYGTSDAGDYSIIIASEAGPVANTGNLSAVGGDATAANGVGGYSSGILLFGYEPTNNSGTLAADGGDGGSGTGTGGDGGDITIRSSTEFSVNTAGSMTSTAGTGATPGEAGIQTIDGMIL